MGFSRRRFFRQEIELTLRLIGVAALVGLIILPVAWGVEQRRQARAWQNVACEYRIKEVARMAPFIANVERGPDACTTLARLGFQLSEPEFVVLPTNARMPTTNAGLPTRTR
jgi:hypothetical protein